jgi:hypothetical protein
MASILTVRNKVISKLGSDPGQSLLSIRNAIGAVTGQYPNNLLSLDVAIEGYSTGGGGGSGSDGGNG